MIELLASEPCAVTALGIDARLEGVGRASVYRALDQLEELGLVQRVEMGAGPVGYERVEPGGGHHHHLLCERCGAITPFTDRRLEGAIEAVGRRSGFRVSAHDVLLRGACERCAGRS